ncbi:hypothetical protein PUV47_13450 [Pseudovibrio exalbescens]|uniref:hypothetical protein n=1 Tax=Pseudovibrio exalbescens TaxID=197461 RepID=UPI002365B147|nr:hypothetical protein [Pseudovibrio exalbescens]MDD7910928.1 hypothetical protein [Pseudovibrio exalbescens]
MRLDEAALQPPPRRWSASQAVCAGVKGCNSHYAEDGVRAMPWNFESEENTFNVSQDGDWLVGVFNGDTDNQSSVSFTTTIDFDDAKAQLPADMWAQFGYMTTNPTGEGLGYMLCFVAATRALEQDPKVTRIFISSGSVEGGGQALIKKLGGVFDMDLEFETTTGGTLKLPGYIIDVETMQTNSAQGFKNKGWRLS